MNSRALLLFFVFNFYCIQVYSFGMASGYLENDTMILLPGETGEYSIELQNTDSEVLQISFFLDSEIAQVKDFQEFYAVGAENPTQKIILKIEMPSAAKPGQEYIVKYSAVPSSNSENPVNLNIKLTNQFTVIAQGDPENSKEAGEKSPLVGILVIGIFLIAVLLLLKKNNMLIKRITKR